MWPHAKEGGRERYRERVNERAGQREEMESEKIRKIWRGKYQQYPIGEGLG